MGSETPSTNNVREEFIFDIQEYDSTYFPSYETFGTTNKKKDKTRRETIERIAADIFTDLLPAR